MANTDFATFQTQYILDISPIAEYWDLPNAEISQSKNVASAVHLCTLL
jgi:hypothetical protein